MSEMSCKNRFKLQVHENKSNSSLLSLVTRKLQDAELTYKKQKIK